MGRITVQEIGCLGKSENTLNEYDNEISLELLKNKLERIATAAQDNDSYVCYIMGMGAHPKSTYEKLKKTVGVDLIWCGSLLPKYARIFSPFIASYAGLFKVLSTEKIPDIFLALVEQSMAGIYIFPKSFELQFVSAVKSNPMPKDYDFGTKLNKDYFYYIVDADNTESSTGVFEIVSYGVDASFISSKF
jgi:hypothetical protein